MKKYNVDFKKISELFTTEELIKESVYFPYEILRLICIYLESIKAIENDNSFSNDAKAAIASVHIAGIFELSDILQNSKFTYAILDDERKNLLNKSRGIVNDWRNELNNK